MDNQFSLNELYDVFIKTTYPIEIGGKTLAAGEILCVFDKIQIANFNEVKNYVVARGGFDNVGRVFWENTKEVDIVFSQGVFNQLQFALLCNANLIYIKDDEKILISKREEKESDEDGLLFLDQVPDQDFFVYNKETGEKIKDFHYMGDGKIRVSKPYMNVVVDYVYSYENGGQLLKLGDRLIEGFLQLEGKTRVKDDISGKTRTGIIKIPKLKLMSDLSMRLGKNANPVVANFRIKAIPSGTRDNIEIMNILFLNDDIDSDM